MTTRSTSTRSWPGRSWRARRRTGGTITVIEGDHGSTYTFFKGVGEKRLADAGRA